MDKRINLGLIGIVILAVGFMIGLSVRPAAPAPAPTATSAPTQDLDAVRTEAVSTFSADLSSTVPATATASITESETPGTAAPDSTGAPSATPGCLSLRFVRDVTIPDNTQTTPAEVFTKSWLVENNGTCPWQSGFQVILVGGIAMGGSPFPVSVPVGPGGRIQVSIKMVAPTDQTGIVQGTWKMSDGSGKTFGDAMWVTIVVGNGTAPPPTATAKGSPTP